MPNRLPALVFRLTSLLLQVEASVELGGRACGAAFPFWGPGAEGHDSAIVTEAFLSSYGRT